MSDLEEKISELLHNIKLKHGLTQEGLAMELGYGPTYISTILKRGGNEKFFNKLLDFHNSPKKETMQSKTAENYREKRLELKNTQHPHLIPFYDAEAAAGNYDMDMTANTRPTGTIDVGDMLRDSTAAMRIYGNSMTPNYPSGAVLGIVENIDGIIQPGEVYVIETVSSRYLKRLYYNDEKTAYVCYSDNTARFETGPMAGRYFYEPFEIPLTKVKRVFDVTGVIKRNRNSSIIQN